MLLAILTVALAALLGIGLTAAGLHVVLRVVQPPETATPTEKPQHA
ncbi:MAG: hypothetical protein AAGI01_01385 [Myxococcota bacterium]